MAETWFCVICATSATRPDVKMLNPFGVLAETHEEAVRVANNVMTRIIESLPSHGWRDWTVVVNNRGGAGLVRGPVRAVELDGETARVV